MRLVFFDFDGTLTTTDTLWPLACLLSEGHRHRRAMRTAVLLSLVQLKLGLMTNTSFKKRFLQLTLQDESKSRIDGLAQKFHEAKLDPMLNRDVFQELAKHTAAGDHVYLVSSNFDFFLEPLRERWNLKGIFATRAEVMESKFTGQILGRACHGKEKLARVLACFGEKQIREAVAYGNSRSDWFLLNFVQTANWVRVRDSFNVVQAPRAA